MSRWWENIFLTLLFFVSTDYNMSLMLGNHHVLIAHTFGGQLDVQQWLTFWPLCRAPITHLLYVTLVISIGPLHASLSSSVSDYPTVGSSAVNALAVALILNHCGYFLIIFDPHDCFSILPSEWLSCWTFSSVMISLTSLVNLLQIYLFMSSSSYITAPCLSGRRK